MIVYNLLEPRKSRNDDRPLLARKSEQDRADATVRDDDTRGADQFSQIVEGEESDAFRIARPQLRRTVLNEHRFFHLESLYFAEQSIERDTIAADGDKDQEISTTLPA
jgi:hypothetical protein